jgi:hypothetical protein
METLITKQALRATDRLTQTTAALARLLDQTITDIQAVDSEFQEQVLEAVQQTEAYIEQRDAERLKLAVKEAEQNTRALVTGELEARLNGERAAAVEAARNELTIERDQIRQEVERMRQTAFEWDAERAKLTADCERANRLLEQSKNEHDRALAETDEAAAIALEMQIASAVSRVRAGSTAQWDADRAAIVAERNRAQQRLADAESDYEGRLDAAIDKERSERVQECGLLRRELEQALRAAAPAPVVEQPSSDTGAVDAEVARVEGLILATSQIVEDPDTELSAVIRKSAERTEHEAYLRGLRFFSHGLNGRAE